MHHNRFPRSKAHQITAARLRAAEKHLERERAKAPLFAAEIAAEQPSPLERLENIDAAAVKWWQQFRDSHAREWRRGRRILRAVPGMLRRKILARWQQGHLPGNSAYLLDTIRCQLRDAWGIEPADRFMATFQQS